MYFYRSLILSVLMAITSMSYGDQQVVVDAEETTRLSTPVYLEMDQINLDQETGVVLRHEGQKIQTQIQTLEEGKIRVWWILDRLKAGESITYELAIESVSSEAPFYRWEDTPEEFMDLLIGEQPVMRYMYTLYDPENIEETKKPFHHVFSPDGSQRITKGVGGRFSHHRGIFFGYNKIRVDGHSYDTWHARNGEHQLHKKVLHSQTGPVVGSHTVLIHWNDREGKPFIEEKRRLTSYVQPQGDLLIEYESTLESLRGTIELDGDRQHAGAQFRASQYVADHEEQTRFLRPAKWSDLPEDQQINTEEHVDLPWNAMKFSVEEEEYTVAYLSDPANPDGAKFSERLYGRFGEFFPYTLTEEKPLHVRYRFWIHNSRDVSREEIETRYHDLASPPKVRVK